MGKHIRRKLKSCPDLNIFYLWCKYRKPQLSWKIGLLFFFFQTWCITLKTLFEEYNRKKYMSFSINAITSKLMHHVITLLYIALFSLKKKIRFPSTKTWDWAARWCFYFSIGLANNCMIHQPLKIQTTSWNLTKKSLLYPNYSQPLQNFKYLEIDFLAC